MFLRNSFAVFIQLYVVFLFFGNHQLEVAGDLTTRVLDNLISQTEYGLAVTPIYDEGPGNPMLGDAITGKRS